MKEPENTNAEATPRLTRGLLLLRARGLAFAVEADETEGVAEGAAPVPLPHAPAAVLGVVCVRGRMYTLLELHALFATREDAQAADAREEPRPVRVRFAVALRGDEQLALAADEVEGPVQIPHAALEPPDLSSAPARATLAHDGARVHLLDTAALFEAAMHGTERRRQRT